MRQLIRRFGAWLVRWADHGARLHVCTTSRSETHENGVSYWSTAETPHAAPIFMELHPGDECPYCGEKG
jgi:LmbE family N-acetylglucosaminyl deacetylase